MSTSCVNYTKNIVKQNHLNPYLKVGTGKYLSPNLILDLVVPKLIHVKHTIGQTEMNMMIKILKKAFGIQRSDRILSKDDDSITMYITFDLQKTFPLP